MSIGIFHTPELRFENHKWTCGTWMKCSRECIIFSQNNETFEMQVLERGGRILVLEKAGLVCLVQSFASKAKNAAVWDPIFLKSYQTYYIYILSRSTIFAAYQPYQYPYSHHWLPLCHPIQQWLLRRRSVVVTLPRPRQALTSWRTRNHWWGSDGFVFGFRWCWDCLLDDVKTVKIVCWTMLDDCVVGLCYGNATCLYTVTWKQPLLGRFGDSL